MNAAELRKRVLDVIGRGADADISDEEFNSLALMVFAHQLQCNAPYRAYCEALGAGSPARVSHWTEIPAVPTDAFKSAALVCGDKEQAAAVFRTSGTTAGAERRGTHYLLDVSLYNAALRESFAAHLIRDEARIPVLSLIAPPSEQPHSSLSHMIGEVMTEFEAGASGYFADASGLDAAAIRTALRAAETDGTAVLLPGTSLAFVHLVEVLEASGERFRLPAGSRVMDTGGFKGLSREVARADLYARIEHSLGIPIAWIINEYGMTEMSSQFYDGRAGDAGQADNRLYTAPGWVRTLAFDPETLSPAAENQVGVLRHWDLANVDSVLALQTADLGRTGRDGFQLRGRAQGAEARGCSLTYIPASFRPSP